MKSASKPCGTVILGAGIGSPTPSLRITVSGPTRSGKTTLALALARFLCNKGGCTVIVEDTGVRPQHLAAAYKRQTQETIRGLQRLGVVEINQAQTARRKKK